MPRLGWSGDQIADRIKLTLPAKFARDQTSNVWKLLRSISQVFKVNTDGLDELFAQTNLISATGAFLDDYINDLSGIGRRSGENDNDYRNRFYRNVFVYNGTKNGIKSICFDIFGYDPLALVSKERGAFFDAKNFFNDLDGGSHYGSDNGDAFIGYIYLKSAPTSAQFDQLCTIITVHKALGVKIYLKYRKYDVFTGYTYVQIASIITEQTTAKQWLPDRDFYNGRSYYNDKFCPAIYGQDDESGLNHKYIFVQTEPVAGQLDELLETLSENLITSDHVYLVYPTLDFEAN